MSEVPRPGPEERPKLAEETPEETHEETGRIRRVEVFVGAYLDIIMSVLADRTEGTSLNEQLQNFEGLPVARDGVFHFHQLPESYQRAILEVLERRRKDLESSVVLEEQRDEKGRLIDIMFRRLQPEKSKETIRLTFGGECVCGNVVTTIGEVPKTPEPKTKTDKRTKRRYRDWDWPETVPCTCISDITGTPREVQVFHREWLD